MAERPAAPPDPALPRVKRTYIRRRHPLPAPGHVAPVDRPTAEHLRLVRMRHPTLGDEYRWQLIDGQGTIRGISQSGWVSRGLGFLNTQKVAKDLGGLAIWGPAEGKPWTGLVVELQPAKPRARKGPAASPPAEVKSAPQEPEGSLLEDILAAFAAYPYVPPVSDAPGGLTPSTAVGILKPDQYPNL